MKSNQKKTYRQHAEKIKDTTKRLGNNEETTKNHTAVSQTVSAKNLVRNV